MKHQFECPKCKDKSVYFSTYDSFACVGCDIWLEPEANSRHFPKKRPEYPTDVDNFMDHLE